MKKKVKTYRNPSVSITIRKPNHKDRKSFSFTKVVVNIDGSRSQTKMSLKSVESINRNFRSKLIDYNQAITLLEDVKRKELKILKEKLGFELNEKSIINKTNQNVITKYLNTEYTKRKNIKPITHIQIKQEMKSILNILGSDVSLLKDDQDTIYYKLASDTRYSHENSGTKYPVSGKFRTP
ncbi:hypothetical protein OAT67_03475 [Bacteriovoracaceae bacterium]|nr:hypothetical protein [Bacteriovoracaceae bacterium]